VYGVSEGDGDRVPYVSRARGTGVVEVGGMIGAPLWTGIESGLHVGRPDLGTARGEPDG
jgi:hypothetical protein